MCKSTGCLGSLIRVGVALLNCVFLLIGIAMLVLGLVLKFSTYLASYIQQLQTFGVPNTTFTYLDYVYIGLIVVGAVVLVISLIGLVGALWGNRLLLIVYDLIILIILVLHVAVFIYVIVVTSQVEGIIRGMLANLLSPVINQLNSTVYNTSYNLSQSQLSTYCQPYTIISDFLSCCDFTNANLTSACCPSSYSGNCADASYTFMVKWVVYVVDLPNGLIIAFELLILVGVAFVIFKKWKSRRDENKVAPLRKAPELPRPSVFAQ